MGETIQKDIIIPEQLLDSEYITHNNETVHDILDRIDIKTSNEYELQGSAAGGLRLLEMTGKTEQKTLTGKNLFSGWAKGVSINATNGEEVKNDSSATSDYISVDFLNNIYYFSGLPNVLYSFVAFYDEEKNYIGRIAGAGRSTLVLKQNATIDSVGITIGSSNCKYVRIKVYEDASLTGTIDLVDSLQTQLEIGETATDYEPYCGGVPSPNPDYPQTIENVGDCVEIENGDISSTTGAYLTTNSYVRTKRFIPCSPNDVIYVKTNIIKSIFINYFNENGFVVTQKSLSTDEATFTAPSGATKFIVSVGRSTDASISPDEIKISLTVNGKHVVQIVEHGNIADYSVNTVINGVEIKTNNKILSIAGKSTKETTVSLWSGVLKAGEYKFAPCQSSSDTRVVLYKSDTAVRSQAKSDVEYTFVADGLAKYEIKLVVLSAYNGNNTVEAIIKQEKVATILLDEPLREGDRLIKVDGVWNVERNIKEWIFDGSESWSATYSTKLLKLAFSYTSNFNGNSIGDYCGTGVCNYFKWNSLISDIFDTVRFAHNNGNITWFYPSKFETLDEWKAWVTEQYNSGNPLTIQYNLATPTLTPLDLESQKALNSLETFKDMTYVEVDSKIKPAGIKYEYGKSGTVAYTLKALLNSETALVMVSTLETTSTDEPEVVSEEPETTE